MSRDDTPSCSVRCPGAITQRCASTDQYDNSRSPTCIVTCCVRPGDSVMRWNPTSARAGIGTGADDGGFKYNCGTSLASCVPLLRTVNVASKPSPAAVTAKPEYSNSE